MVNKISVNMLFRTKNYLSQKQVLSSYMVGQRSDIFLIDLEKSIYTINRACSFLKGYIGHNSSIALLGFNSKTTYEVLKLHNVRDLIFLSKLSSSHVSNWFVSKSLEKELFATKTFPQNVNFPKVLVSLDPFQDVNILKLLKSYGIVIIAPVSSDLQLNYVTYPILYNSNSTFSRSYLSEYLLKHLFIKRVENVNK